MKKRSFIDLGISLTTVIAYTLLSVFTTTIGFFWNRLLCHWWKKWRKKNDSAGNDIKID
jgi:hypothetical protein